MRRETQAVILAVLLTLTAAGGALWLALALV